MDRMAKVLGMVVLLFVVWMGAATAEADELVVTGTLDYTHTTMVEFCGGLNCSATQNAGPFTVQVPQFPGSGLGELQSARLEATPAAGGLFAWGAAVTCDFTGVCVGTTTSLAFLAPGLSLTVGVTLPDACDTMTPQHCSGQVGIPATAGPAGSAQVSAGALAQYIGDGSVTMTVRYTFTENVAVSNSSHPVNWQEQIVTSTPIRVVYTYTPAPPACPADFDGNGAVDSADISAFLTAWLASIGEGTLVADFNGDNVVDSNDISAFLTAWLAAVGGNC